MNIQTKFHGEIMVEENQLWTFPKGMPGFEGEKQFVLLPIEGNEVFQVLQSTMNADVAFIVGNPYSITKDYTFKIDEPTVELLDIEKPEDIFVLTVISLKEPFEASTVNLQAPLIFQPKNKIARQMILNDTKFTMRHPIGKELAASEGER